MVKQTKVDDNREYFIATYDENGEYLIYSSEAYKLSELEMINLIKILLIEERSKSIGRRVLSIYRDSNAHRKHIIQKHLEMIGIKEEVNNAPVKSKNGNTTR